MKHEDSLLYIPMETEISPNSKLLNDLRNESLSNSDLNEKSLLSVRISHDDTSDKENGLLYQMNEVSKRKIDKNNNVNIMESMLNSTSNRNKKAIIVSELNISFKNQSDNFVFKQKIKTYMTLIKDCNNETLYAQRNSGKDIEKRMSNNAIVNNSYSTVDNTTNSNVLSTTNSQVLTSQNNLLSMTTSKNRRNSFVSPKKQKKKGNLTILHSAISNQKVITMLSKRVISTSMFTYYIIVFLLILVIAICAFQLYNVFDYTNFIYFSNDLFNGYTNLFYIVPIIFTAIRTSIVSKSSSVSYLIPYVNKVSAMKQIFNI